MFEIIYCWLVKSYLRSYCPKMLGVSAEVPLARVTDLCQSSRINCLMPASAQKEPPWETVKTFN